MSADLAPDKLRGAGFPEADIHILPLGETASFVARYRGDATGGRPVLLTAHMDVVTAKPEEWERDPFTLIEENGYFFGRGTSDINLTSTGARPSLRSERAGFVQSLIVVEVHVSLTGGTWGSPSEHVAVINVFRPVRVSGAGDLSSRGKWLR